MARSKGTTRKKDRGERREEALRPCHSLGYDRDALGVHLVKRGAYGFAAPQLRRAIWLNPYEPLFKQHLAWCLYKQGDYRQAKEWTLKALEQQEDQDARRLLRLIEETLSQEATENQHG